MTLEMGGSFEQVVLLEILGEVQGQVVQSLAADQFLAG